jgi:hypothetical protein
MCRWGDRARIVHGISYASPQANGHARDRGVSVAWRTIHSNGLMPLDTER